MSLSTCPAVTKHQISRTRTTNPEQKHVCATPSFAAVTQCVARGAVVGRDVHHDTATSVSSLGPSFVPSLYSGAFLRSRSLVQALLLVAFSPRSAVALVPAVISCTRWRSQVRAL